MDPNAALALLREFVRSADDEGVSNADVETAVDAFRGLDEWITGGGFLPFEWDRQAISALHQAGAFDIYEGDG